MAERFSDIVVEIAKLRDYCLSDTHPRGRHKARVFRSRLALTAADAELSAKRCWTPRAAARMICGQPTLTPSASAMSWTSP